MSKTPMENQRREHAHRIEESEAYLRELGFLRFRVRDHGELARIEIAADEMPRALAAGMLATLATAFKTFGFQYVTLDCDGYRSGEASSP
jgi:uncharacterized protein